MPNQEPVDLLGNANAAGANPPDNGSLKIWNNVPDRSILELQLDSTNPAFAGSVRFVSDDGRVETWPNGDINPGPKRRLLSQTAVGYVATVLVAFDSDDPAPVGIRARIVDPNGAAFGTEYFHAVTGQRGDIQHATLLISMVGA